MHGSEKRREEKGNCKERKWTIGGGREGGREGGRKEGVITGRCVCLVCACVTRSDRVKDEGKND